MNVRLFSEHDREAWDAFVARSTQATNYHQSAWRDVLVATFGHQAPYLLAEDRDGRISGVLPLVQQKSRLFGNSLVSLPCFTYGGIAADSADAAAILLEGAVSVARDCGAAHIELRHDRPALAGLPVKTAKVAMRRDLPGSAGDLWKEFPSKLRSQINRPLKEGMSAEVNGPDSLERFYGVYSRNMRDLGTPVYGPAFFRNIRQRFPDSTWIVTVSLADGRTVAAGFLAAFRGMMEIPWASSLRSANHLSPNMLLYWTALTFAIGQGCRVFDFGRSTPGEGTYRFKEQWGARPQQLYWHYWQRDRGPLPELNPRNPKYRLAIAVWKHLPIAMTEAIGPSIVKYLP